MVAPNIQVDARNTVKERNTLHISVMVPLVNASNIMASKANFLSF